MPPNPDRQARMAARREQMANDPALEDARQSASASVLGSYEQPKAASIEPPAAAPRPMLPNWYRRGGKANKYSKGGKVISSREY